MTARLWAPAKLTVSLRVEGVRPDGYHDLSAEMVAVDLCDEIDLEAAGEGITLTYEASAAGAPAVGTGTDNLVAQALTAVERRARVAVRKRIPVGGGLGGGSADAAAVLRWAGVDDLTVAARLGADVPFCLRGGRAMVRGIGDEVESLPFEERSYVLLLPPFGVDTGAVYRRFDESPTRAEAPQRNDLEAAAVAVEPRLGPWRDELAQRTGAVPRLAGSGSTWFVEGTLEGFGLPDLGNLTVEGASAPLVEVRAVPPGWEWGR
jgi:4-diphosphocytidyl-2-C-methyl-D-erythritol kinase